MKSWWQSIHQEEIKGGKASAKANATKYPRAGDIMRTAEPK